VDIFDFFYPYKELPNEHLCSLGSNSSSVPDLN